MNKSVANKTGSQLGALKDAGWNSRWSRWVCQRSDQWSEYPFVGMVAAKPPRNTYSTVFSVQSWYIYLRQRKASGFIVAAMSIERTTLPPFAPSEGALLNCFGSDFDSITRPNMGAPAKTRGSKDWYGVTERER